MPQKISVDFSGVRQRGLHVRPAEQQLVPLGHLRLRLPDARADPDRPPLGRHHRYGQTGEAGRRPALRKNLYFMTNKKFKNQ